MTACEYSSDGEHARLGELLENWARWMRGYEIRKQLEAKTSGLFSSGSSDFDGMLNQADLVDATVVNAVIEGLTPAEQCAVHHAHLNAVWRFTREPWDLIYRRSRVKISDGLRRKGVSELIG